jgi:hypothetical protein
LCSQQRWKPPEACAEPAKSGGSCGQRKGVRNFGRPICQPKSAKYSRLFSDSEVSPASSDPPEVADAAVVAPGELAPEAEYAVAVVRWVEEAQDEPQVPGVTAVPPDDNSAPVDWAAVDCSAAADSVPGEPAPDDCWAALRADDHSAPAALPVDNSVPVDWAAVDCSAAADSVPDDSVPDDCWAAPRADDHSAPAVLPVDNSVPVDWAADDCSAAAGSVPGEPVPDDCWAAPRADDHSAPAVLPDGCSVLVDSAADDCSVAADSVPGDSVPGDCWAARDSHRDVHSLRAD